MTETLPWVMSQTELHDYAVAMRADEIKSLNQRFSRNRIPVHS